jgi:hypothetical protein
MPRTNGHYRMTPARRRGASYSALHWYLGGTYSVLNRIEKEYGVDTSTVQFYIGKVKERLAERFRKLQEKRR